jgi:carbon storage regulator
MLVLSRKANQSIMIGSDIRILVVGVDRDQVKLGIEAPRNVPVHRLEIFTEINRAAAAAAVAAAGKAGTVGKAGSEADIPGLPESVAPPVGAGTG